MLVLRSLVFNIVFYIWTAISCVGLLWGLVAPHRAMIWGIRGYMRSLVFLERTLIGLKYEVRGREHMPKHGAFLVGAKHQSMWETMKLHLLMDDPAIVLKKELTYIPIWGWYASKARMIAVDRGKRGAAIQSLLRGARERVAEGRPIVIFPQGTRTAVGAWRPYKVGIALLYQNLNVPIVPMALNSGLFWPRHKFLRRPGTITIEFLPPIPPGLPKEEALKRLETALETATDRLVMAAGGPPTDRPANAPPLKTQATA
ncbi:lysophospholipid acyltransferase family protein [Nitrospirillum iridis]|uniref:1-acyl-sn-glycerol-3-phosphate acyltransferase n=1 Tax=Nitrospirillum iridis TaxID=765888 RepID=A0A7X0EFK0_9PROT|nr:lysophospholipid acyltransferase family protein [Nitrospirillum iridis]MBB6254070.1 1-acyl-sn-glycerol-3-phosphate acyltransferase [Nitrospirillum iridis]